MIMETLILSTVWCAIYLQHKKDINTLNDKFLIFTQKVMLDGIERERVLTNIIEQSQRNFDILTEKMNIVNNIQRDVKDIKEFVEKERGGSI